MNAGEQLIAEGRAEGLRNGITHLLAARRLPLSELGRARLASCARESLLMVWLERAATASSEAEVFTGSESA